jgi:hypothetical protein
MIAAVPRQGGATWAVLQYLLGLRQLGYEAFFVEPVARQALRPEGTGLADSQNAAYFRQVVQEFGLSRTSALLLVGTRETVGVPYAELARAAGRASVLLNLSGLLTDPELTGPVPIRVYLDLDPAFTQLWHAVQGVDMRFAGHTDFATVGLALGRSDCPVPTCGLSWLPTLPPVVLEHWPVAGRVVHEGLTTVGHWRGYGSVETGGTFYGQRAHSFRQLFTLPTQVEIAFMPALAIHPDEVKDLCELTRNGWRLQDPDQVAADPVSYRRFIEGSWAEFGVAKSGYVESRCGWFSDRSACYLAAGRPVIAQDTGFGRFLPTGEGLFAFCTAAEVLTAVESLRAEYPRHARAARAIAEEHFASDRVLTRLLALVGVGP